VKYAICNELFGDRVEEALPAIAAAGYEGVELAPATFGKGLEEPSAGARRNLKQRATDLGLVFTGIHWLLAGAEDLHISSPDQFVRARTLARLNSLSRLCADLGGTYLVFGSPAQRSTPNGTTKHDARARALELFHAWGEQAQDDGTVVCLEALPETETDFLNTTADVLAAVSEIALPSVQMVLDVKSMSTETVPIPDLIASAADHLAYVQANDANRRGPGLGDTDFVPIFRALRQVGYDGVVSVEPFAAPTGIGTEAAYSLRYLRASAQQATA
jgi:D-psicose/D-tagatose/L-ribulose 3-epimerase